MERSPAGKFRAGRSGNPKGRPIGAKNKVARKVEKLIIGELESIAHKLIERAKDGNTQAATVLFRTVIGAMRERSMPIRFELPELNTPADAVEAMRAIAHGIASGELTGDDARALTAAVDGFTKAIEAHDHATRLSAIEEQLKPKTGK